MDKAARLFTMLAMTQKGAPVAGELFNFCQNKSYLADLLWKIGDPAVLAIIHLQSESLGKGNVRFSGKFNLVIEIMVGKYGRADFFKVNELLSDEDKLAKNLFVVSADKKAGEFNEKQRIETETSILSLLIGNKEGFTALDQQKLGSLYYYRGFMLWDDNCYNEESVILLGPPADPGEVISSLREFCKLDHEEVDRILVDLAKSNQKIFEIHDSMNLNDDHPTGTGNIDELTEQDINILNPDLEFKGYRGRVVEDADTINAQENLDDQ